MSKNGQQFFPSFLLLLWFLLLFSIFVSFFVTEKILPAQLDPGWATLYAGILALIAGWLVYQAAMTSLKEERLNKADKEQHQKLNLYLKVQHIAFLLIEIYQVNEKSAQIAFMPDVDEEDARITIQVPQLKSAHRKQLDEIWQDLSLLDPSLINEITRITQYFDLIDNYIFRNENLPSKIKTPLFQWYSQLSDAARVVKEITSKNELVIQYSAEYPDRDTILYGEPELN